jgi:hypothetical protein
MAPAQPSGAVQQQVAEHSTEQQRREAKHWVYPHGRDKRTDGDCRHILEDQRGGNDDDEE